MKDLKMYSESNEVNINESNPEKKANENIDSLRVEYDNLIYKSGTRDKLSNIRKEGVSEEDINNLKDSIRNQLESYLESYEEQESGAEELDEIIKNIKKELSEKFEDVDEVGYIVAVNVLSNYFKWEDNLEFTRGERDSEKEQLIKDKYVSSIIELITINEDTSDETKEKQAKNFDNIATMLIAYGGEKEIVKNIKVIKEQIPEYDHNLLVDNIYLAVKSSLERNENYKVNMNYIFRVIQDTGKFYEGEFSKIYQKEFLEDEGIIKENEEKQIVLTKNVTIENVDKAIDKLAHTFLFSDSEVIGQDLIDSLHIRFAYELTLQESREDFNAKVELLKNIGGNLAGLLDEDFYYDEQFLSAVNLFYVKMRGSHRRNISEELPRSITD